MILAGNCLNATLVIWSIEELLWYLNKVVILVHLILLMDCYCLNRLKHIHAVKYLKVIAIIQC